MVSCIAPTTICPSSLLPLTLTFHFSLFTSHLSITQFTPLTRSQALALRAAAAEDARRAKLAALERQHAAARAQARVTYESGE
jgi:hypothetical protein